MQVEKWIIVIQKLKLHSKNLIIDIIIILKRKKD